MKGLVQSMGLAAIVIAAPVAAQTTVTLGAEHVSGSYGTDQKIRTSRAAATVRSKRKAVTLFASLPIVRTDGPANIVAPGGPLGLPIFSDPTQPAGRRRRSGLGDAEVGAALSVLPPRPGKLALAVTGAAKLPTGSARKGLSTGKTDVSVGAELARPGRLTPFAGVGYTIVGRPDDFRLRNVTSARGGVALRVGKDSEVSLAYRHASRASDLVGARSELGAGVDTALSRRLRLGVQGSAGLSRGAPDVGAGVQLGFRL